MVVYGTPHIPFLPSYLPIFNLFFPFTCNFPFIFTFPYFFFWFYHFSHFFSQMTSAAIPRFQVTVYFPTRYQYRTLKFKGFNFLEKLPHVPYRGSYPSSSIPGYSSFPTVTRIHKIFIWIRRSISWHYGSYPFLQVSRNVFHFVYCF